MNYYDRHIGDFIKDTIGLSMLEDGAYNRLLDQVYQTERPLPLDRGEVYRLARATSAAERKAVNYVLEKFFEQGPDGWMQKRAQEILEAYWEREPEEEQKRESARQRQQRCRERRAAMFAELRDHGIVPPYNAKNKELAALLEGVKSPATSQSRHDPVTRDDTATQTPVTNNHKKPPNPLSSPDGEAFGRFWDLYPRKVGKKDAQKAWAKLPLDEDLLTAILQAVEAQRSGWDWTKDDGAYIPHPATWLNGGRWLDEVRTAPPSKAGITQWWTSIEKMRLKGQEFVPPLVDRPGEQLHDFKARIIAAIEQRDKGEIHAEALLPYVPPDPVGGESKLTDEQRAERLQELLAMTGSRRVQPTITEASC